MRVGEARHGTVAIGLALAIAVGLTTGAEGASRREALPSGALVQMNGRLACTSDGARDGCAAAHALRGASSIVLSPDGHRAYAASNNSSSVTVLARARRGGGLRPRPGRSTCVSEDGSDGCRVGRGLRGAFNIAMSADARNLYVASYQAIAVFRRDPRSGAIEQLPGATGCVSEGGAEGCDAGRALNGLASVTVSPDGRHVYAAAAGSGAVAVFSRDPLTGAIHQLAGADGCTNETGADGCSPARAVAGAFSVAISMDGHSAYVASLDRNAIAIFSRNPGTGTLRQLPLTDACVAEGGAYGCTTGHGLRGPNTVTVSGGGTDVYAAASEGSAVSVFRRDPVTGTLAQLGGGNGCTSEGGTDGCATGHGLTGAFGVTLSHDGTNAYVASLSAISSFLRVAPSGRLVEFPGRAGCISERGTDGCAPGRGLRGASTIVLSDDGRNAYAASFNSGAISAFQRVRAGGKRR